MSSARRRAAAGANGKKSKGPVTPEGKARSAATATRNGLSSPAEVAQAICFTSENPARYTLLHQSLIEEHAPVTATEHDLVEEMAICRWRLHRAWLMETALLDHKMDETAASPAASQEPTDHAVTTALAFRDLAEDSPALPLLHRCETRLSRQYSRCLKTLRSLRAEEISEIPTEPKPESEQAKMTQQFLPNHSPRPLRTRNLCSTAGPSSLPLNEHPKWSKFQIILGDMILDHYPDLRPRYLELLNRADLL